MLNIIFNLELRKINFAQKLKIIHKIKKSILNENKKIYMFGLKIDKNFFRHHSRKNSNFKIGF